MANQVVLQTFNYRHEAELLRGLLEAAGIAAFLSADDLGALDPALSLVNGIEVRVSADDLPRAQAVLAEARQARAEGASAPVSLTLSGDFRVTGTVEEVFPLFSPLGERAWVPGWDPELLYPPGATWEAGQIFRTREGDRVAVWIVTALDRAAHTATYHRVEPDRYVARVDVSCTPIDDRSTGVVIVYTYVGLSEGGNDEIGRMTRDAHAEKMARWRHWIDAYLATTRTTP